MNSHLRPYQAKAIESARGELRKGNLRQVIYAPTGAGKTILAEVLIKSALEKGKRVVFLANRIGLIQQTSKRFYKAGIQHGIIQGENTRNLEQLCLIASIQTVATRGLPPDVALIIIDEAHACAGSKAYKQVIFTYNALPVIGLTATPFSHGMGKEYTELGSEPLFQSIVIAATIRELIDAGYLVDCDIYAPEKEVDLSGVKLVKNKFGELDYEEKALAVEVDKPQLIGNIVNHWLKIAKDKPTVCFATNIAHSKNICEQFLAQGIKAEHIDCYLDDDERKAVLKRVESGETTVVTNVGILAEGWDEPKMECMILAKPTKSLIKWIQMCGRILRPYGDKEIGIILDHSGSTHEMGYPTDDLPLELHDGTANSNNSANKGEEKEAPKPKKCPSCQFMKPAGVHVCPKCQFAPAKPNTIESTDGELQKVDRKARKTAEQTYGTKQDVYSQLLTIQSESKTSKRPQGYSDGWVANQYRSIFDVWPRGMQDIKAAPSTALRGKLTNAAIRFSKGVAKGQLNVPA